MSQINFDNLYIDRINKKKQAEHHIHAQKIAKDIKVKAGINRHLQSP